MSSADSPWTPDGGDDSSRGLLDTGELLAEESRMITSAAAVGLMVLMLPLFNIEGIDAATDVTVGAAVTMGVWGSGCEGSTI